MQRLIILNITRLFIISQHDILLDISYIYPDPELLLISLEFREYAECEIGYQADVTNLVREKRKDRRFRNHIAKGRIKKKEILESRKSVRE